MIRFVDAKPAAPPSATNKAKSATNAKSANGRDREAFNAYQRDYMRKRRAAVKTQGA